MLAALALILGAFVTPLPTHAQSPQQVTLPTTYWINAGSGNVSFLTTASGGATIYYIASNTPPGPGATGTSLSLTANLWSSVTSTSTVWVQAQTAGVQISILATMPGNLGPSANLPQANFFQLQAPLINGWTPGQVYNLSTTIKTIKANPGQLGWLDCYNPNGSAASVQLFDALAGNVTLGTTAPNAFITLGATSGRSIPVLGLGLQFLNGIAFAATTTPTGSTAPGSALQCSYGFN
jgi:hypothetical protein